MFACKWLLVNVTVFGHLCFSLIHFFPGKFLMIFGRGFFIISLLFGAHYACTFLYCVWYFVLTCLYEFVFSYLLLGKFVPFTTVLLKTVLNYHLALEQSLQIVSPLFPFIWHPTRTHCGHIRTHCGHIHPIMGFPSIWGLCYHSHIMSEWNLLSSLFEKPILVHTFLNVYLVMTLLCPVITLSINSDHMFSALYIAASFLSWNRNR